MILFGTATRITATAELGQFVCPRCRAKTSFAYARRRTYFHIFFLPVATLSDERDGVLCGSCNAHLDESEVHRSASRRAGKQMAVPRLRSILAANECSLSDL